MNESDVSRKVREALQADGAVCWKVSDHFHASRPDLLFIYKGITGYIETKMHPNKPTEMQTFTLVDIASHGAPTYWLSYHKVKRTLTLTDIIAGTEHTFTAYKELSSWLLKPSCLRTSSMPLTK